MLWMVEVEGLESPSRLKRPSRECTRLEREMVRSCFCAYRQQWILFVHPLTLRVAKGDIVVTDINARIFMTARCPHPGLLYGYQRVYLVNTPNGSQAEFRSMSSDVSFVGVECRYLFAAVFFNLLFYGTLFTSMSMEVLASCKKSTSR